MQSCFLNARGLLWSWTPATVLRAAAVLPTRLKRREERQSSSILSRIPEKTDSMNGSARKATKRRLLTF